MSPASITVEKRERRGGGRRALLLVAGVAGAERRALVQVLCAGALLLVLTYGPRLWRRYVRRTPVR
ncbi:hypothetical protein FGE12_16340 [Aggregicoccus sp. 17bor-14]|uniref:hypothetical protein n=1 Tax=Myxococcaceae TaxID=31 RepID=UPI00129CF904|nr:MULTISPECIES: hypothetical protein [Myxococcaceae]MBF5043970.1 hypothetical protein [Simulacricoccus sp. 17bor-14]MRI89721.1 hypothetical protein [Aggregicoccus sp. 17bor-14]